MTHRYPKEGESFADYYPDKISIWGVKNTLTPFDYCKSSGEKIWWTCPNGHYENGLNSPYRKEPTEKLIETIRRLINND